MWRLPFRSSNWVACSIKSSCSSVRAKSSQKFPQKNKSHRQTNKINILDQVKTKISLIENIQSALGTTKDIQGVEVGHDIEAVNLNPVKPVKPKTNEKPLNFSQTEVNNLTLSLTLGSYCDGCRAIGNIELAMNKFHIYQEIWLKKHGKMTPFGNVFLYHSYFALVAELGDVRQWEIVYRTLKDNALEFDQVCLMHSFRMFARTEKSALEESSAVQEIMSTLSVEHLKGIYKEFSFIRKQESEFLTGLRMFYPDFNKPDKSTRSMYEHCPLLKEEENLSPVNLATPLATPARGNFNDLFQKQIETESGRFFTVRSILPQNPELETTNKLINKLVEGWKKKLDVDIEKRISNHLYIRADSYEGTMTVYPFFKLLDTKDFAEIVVHEIVNLLRMSETYSRSVSQFQHDIGNSVLNQVQMKSSTSSDPEYFSTFCSVYEEYVKWLEAPNEKDSDLNAVNHRDAILKLADRKGLIKIEREYLEWPFSVKLAIGRELLNLVMHNISVKTDQEGRLVVGDITVGVSQTGDVFTLNSSADKDKGSCPIFFKVFRARKNQREVEELKPLPALSKLFSADKFTYLDFDAKELPMLVPPRPWTSLFDGGYLLRTHELVRAPSEGKLKPDKYGKDITPVLDSLNQLGTTPWKINQHLFDIILDVFINQKEYEKYLNRLGVPRHQDLLEPPKLDPEFKETMESNKFTSVSRGMKEYKEYLSQKQAFAQVKSECYSLWCDSLYKLSIANHFRHDILYFPHNMDFRGRVYPIAPYLNHMGADLARSLLVFAVGKPLGPKGLEWLKLQTINLSGLKKRDPIDSRLEYAEEILSDILDSATDPFGGNQWWLESEDPWQTLGVCIEIKAAIDSGDPESYVSHLPIHQDGSCNGLQHYAALGRDVLGARSVNLLPASCPQDVYSEIAAIVDRKRQEDADSGVEIAEILKGFIYRKVIKQTVMTTVYGVTRYGAKLQIARQLRDNERFPSVSVDEASAYLAKKTFESLNEMFHASQTIQAWFTECANVISGELFETVSWVTPLGLHVAQPYYKRTRTLTASTADEMCSVDPILANKFDIYSKPNVMKQRNGFPPNFVHSLDSTHMMLTSLSMWQSGKTFASVHDCYWSHACSVDEMNKICREQFVKLHSYPILESLSLRFCDLLEANTFLRDINYVKAKRLFESVPEKGELDLEQVKDSIYFFS